jgi:hypothetical protein
MCDLKSCDDDKNQSRGRLLIIDRVIVLVAQKYRDIDESDELGNKVAHLC